MIPGLHFAMGEKCEIFDTTSERLVAVAHRTNTGRLYRLQTAASDTHMVNSISIDDDSILWHRRMGHVSASTLVKTAPQAVGMSPPALFSKCECLTCVMSKAKTNPFPTSHSKTTMAGELLHADLCGPYITSSSHGYKYFMLIVDDFSRFTWVKFLTTKSEAVQALQDIITRIEKDPAVTPSVSVRAVRTDLGKEFVNSNLTKWLTSRGIQFQTTVGYAPQQNGVVEKRNHLVQTISRGLMLDSGLPQDMWSYSVRQAVYILNRTYSSTVQDTPFGVLYQTKPDLSSLRVFGCLVHSTIPLVHRKTFESQTRPGIYLGYKDGLKGDVLYDMEKKQTFYSRDVVYFENTMPFKDAPKCNPLQLPQMWPLLPIPPHMIPPSLPFVPFQPPPEVAQEVAQEVTPLVTPSVTPLVTPAITSEVTRDVVQAVTRAVPPATQALPAAPPVPSTPPATPPEAFFTPVQSLGDHAEASFPVDEDTPSSPVPTRTFTRLNRGAKKGDPNFVYSCGTNTSCPDSAPPLPQTYKEAIASPLADGWTSAMIAEVDSFNSQQAFTMMECPVGVRPIPGKWVYSYKRDTLGNIVRQKARFVAKGFVLLC